MGYLNRDIFIKGENRRVIKVTRKFSKALSGLNFIDLFAGIGGFHLALKSFGANPVFSSEWDSKAQDVYENNFGIRPAGDITKIEASDIPAHDILCAGFPCQAFSISGSQKGFEDARGTLFFEISRIVEYHRPRFLFLENVKNFERHDSGRTLETVRNILKELGYSTHCKVLNASHFGIPQKRERIFILGFRDGLGVSEYEFPIPNMKQCNLENVLLPDDETQEFVIQRDDIVLDVNKQPVTDMYGNYPLKPFRIGTVNKGGQGERIYHTRGHSVTLSAYGGGVGAKTGLYFVNGKVRRLSPRECARLTGFPDSFRLSPLRNQSFKQFGNCVVVDVLQFLIQDLLEKGVLDVDREQGCKKRVSERA